MSTASCHRVHRPATMTTFNLHINLKAKSAIIKLELISSCKNDAQSHHLENPTDFSSLLYLASHDNRLGAKQQARIDGDGERRRYGISILQPIIKLILYQSKEDELK
eukprot:scpid105534/ scgid19297/ 